MVTWEPWTRPGSGPFPLPSGLEWGHVSTATLCPGCDLKGIKDGKHQKTFFALGILALSSEEHLRNNFKGPQTLSSSHTQLGRLKIILM